MRPEGNFIAERLAAQHCAELLRGTRQAPNPLKELAQFGEQVAERLARQLGPLCAGARAQARALDPVELQPNAANEKRGEPMLNSVVAVGPKEVMMIASLPQRAVLSLVDVALGGSGKDCGLPLGKLPLSAQLMHGRFEKVLAGVIAQALGLDDAEQVKFRGAAPEAGMPLAGCKRTVQSIELAIAEAEPCELAFVFPGATLASLFSGNGKARDAAAPAASKIQPHAEPFAGIPLPLTAILVDMPVPVSTLSKLRPGMVIPVTVARSVPLMAGEQVIAHGTVGAMDDCNALQLNRITSIKEK